jgi:hypothetical protein
VKISPHDFGRKFSLKDMNLMNTKHSAPCYENDNTLKNSFINARHTETSAMLGQSAITDIFHLLC